MKVLTRAKSDTERETRMDTMVDMLEALMREYAEFADAPFPPTWEGTAFEDDSEAASKFEAAHPAYFAAWRWLEKEVS